MFSILLRQRYAPKTSAPSANACSAKWLPTNPVIPVMSRRVIDRLPLMVSDHPSQGRVQVDLGHEADGGVELRDVGDPPVRLLEAALIRLFVGNVPDRRARAGEGLHLLSQRVDRDLV